MAQKNYKVLCRLKCLLLAMVIILNSSISANAYKILENDIIYTCYNKDNGISGFFYVIEEDGNKEIVYCYNENLKQPSSNGTSGYKKYNYFSSEINTVSSEIKSEIAAILYAGYPNNALGFMEEFGVSEEKARQYTQDAIWSLTRGEDHTDYNISRNSYLHALYFYAEKENGTYGDTGSVSMDQETILTQIDGVWKSNILTINGDYTGSIKFNNLPQNITIYDAKTNNPVNSSVKIGDSIYIVYSGEVEGNLSTTLTYNYETTDTVFYKSADNSYQDMIGFKVKSNEGKISISAENENKELPSKNTNANITINKVEKGTTNKLVGAVLGLYEGTSDSGRLIEEWTTTNESKKIKVEAGKTYTLVEKSAPEGYEIAEPITFTVDSSIVNSENINIIEEDTDYVGYRYNSERYITDGQSTGIVYCINHDLDNPDAVLSSKPPSLSDPNYPHYRHWVLSSVSDEILRENQTVDFTREQLAEVLLVGYPTDYYGYQQKYNLNNSQAYSRTQAVLDAVLSGDTSLKSTSGLSGEYLALTNYYNDLVKAYLSPKIENSTSVVDFFRWVDGTGKSGKTYQNLVGITDFENNIAIEVTMEDAKKDIVVVPNISISVEKVWEDADIINSRPNEVEVQLYKDGKTYGNVVKLSNDNDWKYQWNDLDSTYEWTVDEVNVPEGYIKTITNNDTIFTITNTKIAGKLEITKTDIADGKLLPNAGFRIYDENKNLIAEGRTNEQGVATFELGYGKYYYQEFDAPEGYVIDETLFPFEIKTNGEIVKAEMTNTKIAGKLEITKTDIADGKLLPNAGFRIYDENKNVIAEGRTNEQGVATFELGYGKYYYQEFDAPEGYVIDETLFPFEIKTNGEIVKAEMTNTKIAGKLEITKTDIADGKLLPNAGFRIYDENKNVIAEGRTNDQGIATFELEYGKYYYQEFDAPEGYVIDETLFPFEIKTNGEIVKAKMTNTKIAGKLEITKIDIADGKLLPNAGFRIYDENKNVIAEGRTNEQGIATFELEYGKYYYQEFDAPEGYVIDETLFPFEIKTNGEIVKAEMTNTKIAGKLEITKIDIADGKLLPNAGFRIYDENKNVIAEGRTNEQGIATFELEYGKYYYQEFDAPEGYVIDETLFPFEIKTNGEIVKAEMTNTKIENDVEEPEIPEIPSGIEDPSNPEDSKEQEDSIKLEEINNSNSVGDDNENNTLPQTGGSNSIIYLLLGAIISLAGFRLFNIGYKSKR